MTITIEGVNYKLPASLLEITLRQRIDYDKKYGKGLREKLKQIIEIKNEQEKELCFIEYKADVACKTISFFGDIPLETVQNTHINDVLIVYSEVMNSLSDETDFTSEHELKREIFWNKDDWEITAPELAQESKMSFAEFIDAKQMVQNQIDLGDEKWGALLPLCCIYLRKKGEPYDKKLISEGGERMKLFETLPLAYALETGFFFANLTSTYINIFQSSGLREVSREGNS